MTIDNTLMGLIFTWTNVRDFREFCSKLNPPEIFGNGKFTKINPREIFLQNFFLLCFFPPFICQATNTIQMCIMKL